MTFSDGAALEGALRAKRAGIQNKRRAEIEAANKQIAAKRLLEDQIKSDRV